MENNNYSNIHVSLRNVINDAIAKSKKYPALMEEGSELATDAQLYDYWQGLKQELHAKKADLWYDFIRSISKEDRAKFFGTNDNSFGILMARRIKIKGRTEELTTIDEYLSNIELLSLGTHSSIEAHIDNINNYVKVNSKTKQVLNETFVLINTTVQKILGTHKKGPDKVFTKTYKEDNQE